MKGKIKRMLAVLLALALCLGPAPAALAEPAAEDVTQKLKEAIARSESGGVFFTPLSGDSVLSETITIGNKQTLALGLNDHTLTAAAGVPHFKVEAGGTLRLTGGYSGGSLRGSGSNSGGVEVAGGIFLMDAGGTIADCSGGVVMTGGAFEMTGGSITDCRNDNGDGGGVYLTDGTFTLAGGSISDCSIGPAGGAGGGVYVGGGMFNMTGGSIADCDGNGGGVYVAGGTFNLTDGTIAGCSGGVYVTGGSMFKMAGGTITGCSTYKGGGVYVDNGMFTLTGGAITNCGAANGGGVYVYAGQTLAVSGGPTVTGNTDNSGAANNVVLGNDGYRGPGKIAVTGPLADGASLGVTLDGKASDWANQEFLTGLPAGSKAFFPDSDPASYITRGTAGADGKLVTASPPPPPVPDTGLALDKTVLELAPGETAKLKATLTPADATYKYIFWTSSDEAVAAVSDSGLVTAVSEGTAVITAKSWYGHEAACEVTVKRAETPPPADPWPTEGLAGFVTRCYRVALGREPDRAGHADWVRWLSDGTVDATSCTYGFVFSKEMNNKHLSDEAFVKTLYRLFLDREGEAAGVAFWTDYLQAGHGREEVFGGFADSVEFARIKAGYGIR